MKYAFVEGIEEIEKLREIEDISQCRIISFDFHAHKYLNQKNIPHNTIEEFIPKEDQELIDNETINLVLNWHKKIDFDSPLEGFNLGELVEIEITNYFFLNLKRMVGIVNFLKKEIPKEIICFSLAKFVNCIIKNNSVKIIKLKLEKNSTELYFDKIEIPITIKGKTKSLKVSRKNYMKIKKIIEKITDTTLKNDFKLKNNLKNLILFIDFNPVQYQKLFEELTSLNYQIILLNQRRPAIWNKESFNIIKKSNYKILKLEEFKDGVIKNEIDITRRDFWSKFDKKLDEEKLNQIFMIKNYSYWDAIKNNFKTILKKRCDESIERFILTRELFKKINFQCTFDWAHTGAEEKIINFFTKSKKIPLISIQHAIYPLNEKWKKYHPLYPHLPTKDVKEAIWGNMLREYIIENGLIDEQILLSGSPRHDLFFEKEITESKNTVLISANLFVHFNFAGNDTQSYENLERFISEVISILKRKKKKIIVKLHPSQSYHDVKSLIHKIDPKIPIYQNQNILDLIDSCETMISLNFSTILVDAMIRKKPTLVILAEEQGFEKEDLITSNATLTVKNFHELEDKINLLLDNQYREKLISKGNEFVDRYFVNHGCASKKLALLIHNLIKKK